MRKIINGRVYDTSTAKKQAEWTGDFGKSDFRWYHEVLYKKRNGEFFLYGEGHAASQYAKPTGDGFAPGERIEPISLERAQALVEKHLDADDYERLFGKVTDDNSKVLMSMQLPAPLVQELDHYVSEHVIATKTSVMTQALSDYLSSHK